MKRYFSRCGVAAVAFATFFGVESVFAAAMPEEIVKQLSERLPAAFVPVPASGAVKRSIYSRSRKARMRYSIPH